MLRKENWPGAAVFTTHATILGRYLAMNDEGFYSHLPDYDDGEELTSKVARFPATTTGLFDLYGNVSEWVHDWYHAEGNLADGTQLSDPLGPKIGEFRVIKGASWAKGYLPQLRIAYRDFGAKGKYDVGFRVARYADPS